MIANSVYQTSESVMVTVSDGPTSPSLAPRNSPLFTAWRLGSQPLLFWERFWVITPKMVFALLTGMTYQEKREIAARRAEQIREGVIPVDQVYVQIMPSVSLLFHIRVMINAC